jgi:hypothetical protein
MKDDSEYLDIYALFVSAFQANGNDVGKPLILDRSFV